MKVLIIEDEPLSAEHLENLINKCDPSIRIIGKIDSVKNALSLLKRVPEIDLLFLDIHLSDGLSFDIFEEIDLDTPIIFTTAFNEYAVKAFKLNSIDYLLKPIDKAELQKALVKYNKTTKSNSLVKFNKDLEVILNSLNKPYKSRFMVKMGETLNTIKIEDVAFFNVEDGTVMLNTKSGKRYTLDYTLDDLELTIDMKHFFRINRKVLLNIDAIKKVSSYFNSRYKLTVDGLNDDTNVVSRERVNEFKAWLGN
ncbi:MAG: LytR/AlgR family response regulator transcription factor [Bacteroidota bacterium]|jgi:DNA-binding LytR/AlgR family response regulator|nr:response regulator transcription factor [Bacteroidota bacterium]MCA6442943.1 response regulator transcription factor [Bacteroidota bacterium]